MPFSSFPIQVGVSCPVTCVRYLGVLLVSHLSFSVNVSKTFCIRVLLRIRSICSSLFQLSTATLASSLILSRLDYCTSAWTQIPLGERTDSSWNNRLPVSQSSCSGLPHERLNPHLHPPGRGRLPVSLRLFVTSSARYSTFGGRAFTAAAVKTWNSFSAF